MPEESPRKKHENKHRENIKKSETQFSIQNNIDKVRVPVLMAYGMEDWRVPPKHGRILKRALDKNDIPNKLIIKANEGHGFRNEKNVYEFYREVDAFLAEHMK